MVGHDGKLDLCYVDDGHAIGSDSVVAVKTP